MRLSRFRFTKRYRLKDYNCILVALVTALSILGIFVVGSAKEIYQTKQIFGVVAGLIIMVIVLCLGFGFLLADLRICSSHPWACSGDRNRSQWCYQMDQSWIYNLSTVRACEDFVDSVFFAFSDEARGRSE